MDLIKAVEQTQLKESYPNLGIGDHVRVHLLISKVLVNVFKFLKALSLRKGEGLLKQLQSVAYLMALVLSEYFRCIHQGDPDRCRS